MEFVEGLPVWRQIARSLEADIAAEIYPSGSKMPTEAVMVARFGVNRHTVRRAVQFLSEAGKLKVEQGRGTFVCENPIDYHVGERTRFTQNVMANDRLPGRKLVRLEVVKADELVAKNLAILIGTDVVLYESVSSADGRPVCLGSSYLPAKRFEGIIPCIREHQSVTKAFELMGVSDYTRSSTRIISDMPTSEEARHLRVARNRPILRTDSVSVDPTGRRVLFGIGRFAADRIQLVVDNAA